MVALRGFVVCIIEERCKQFMAKVINLVYLSHLLSHVWVAMMQIGDRQGACPNIILKCLCLSTCVDELKTKHIVFTHNFQIWCSNKFTTLATIHLILFLAIHMLVCLQFHNYHMKDELIYGAIRKYNNLVKYHGSTCYSLKLAFHVRKMVCSFKTK